MPSDFKKSGNRVVFARYYCFFTIIFHATVSILHGVHLCLIELGAVVPNLHRVSLYLIALV